MDSTGGSYLFYIWIRMAKRRIPFHDDRFPSRQYWHEHLGTGPLFFGSYFELDTG